jgi:hypothetical protein
VTGCAFTEEELRAQALDKKDPNNRDAIAVLVDFYEQRGQLSRAALWRKALYPHYVREIPDLLTQQPRLSAVDNRRNQMIWLLRTQGLQARAVGDAFDLSVERVRQIIIREDHGINFHSRNEQLHPTMKATERLIAAGALPGDRPTPPGCSERWFSFVDEPPEDWPAEHKRHGKKP